MTNRKIFKLFIDSFWQFPIKDYRPLEPPYYKNLKDREGIIINLKNGDVVVYFPKQGEY